MNKDLTKIIEQFVDYLMPELAPYEAAMYVFLLRNSHLKNFSEIRIGKRTIGEKFGKASKGKSGKVDYGQVSIVLKRLEEKGCIEISNVNREGTLYKIFLPEEIPLVKEKLAIVQESEEEDYFTDLAKRKEIFERDR